MACSVLAKMRSHLSSIVPTLCNESMAAHEIMKHSFFFVSMVGLLFVTACSTPTSSPVATPDRPVSATLPPLPTLGSEEIELGHQVYLNHCAECHGADLEGEANWKTQNEDKSFRAPPHTADGHTWHHPDEQLLEAIRRGGARFKTLNLGGTSEMPAYEEILTEGEMLAVLTYIKSFWPDEIRAIQWQQTQQSQAAANGH
jgi:mono/diheme cytochrome c family protein